MCVVARGCMSSVHQRTCMVITSAASCKAIQNITGSRCTPQHHGNQFRLLVLHRESRNQSWSASLTKYRKAAGVWMEPFTPGNPVAQRFNTATLPVWLSLNRICRLEQRLGSKVLVGDYSHPLVGPKQSFVASISLSLFFLVRAFLSCLQPNVALRKSLVAVLVSEADLGVGFSSLP